MSASETSIKHVAQEWSVADATATKRHDCARLNFALTASAPKAKAKDVLKLSASPLLECLLKLSPPVFLQRLQRPSQFARTSNDHGQLLPLPLYMTSTPQACLTRGILHITERSTQWIKQSPSQAFTM
eukprot:3021362-Amphidinium_carterae.1